ncbi:nitroreductase family protein [Pseudomonas profundi]|uniref:nitroreductase family protein n=1 Tax=Pseudomonas profundi TaxID=1981513 RepID=UPI001238DE75|nr:nitroreductase family protein [Pseudomonas profundi]
MLEILKRKARSFVYYRTPTGEALTKVYDFFHHFKYSFKESRISDKDHLRYYLTKHYHIIEKGLALPEPRLGFGQPKVRDVIEKAKAYEVEYGDDELTSSIRKTLLAYQEFNKKNNFDLPSDLKLLLNSFIGCAAPTGIGGLKQVCKETASPINLAEFSNFAKSRVSVRDFAPEPVSEALIYASVEVAQSAPSVCNRQGWKVYCHTDKLKINEILSYQNGNSGFTDVIDKLIIVAADGKAFTKYESNQVFIDGGLFSMNLMLAIHAAGLGACPLNTCYPSFLEKKVKMVASVAASDRLIMMIAVGNIKDEYSVACSARNPVDDILKFF